jgi:predicted NAD/FAD-binding protein
MGAAIWSTTAAQMRAYPLIAFVRFFASHGLFDLLQHRSWRTVTGGSIAYVDRMAARLRGSIRAGRPVVSIRRLPEGVEITDAGGATDTFADVVVAAHADQALAMLADPDARERELLGAFAYTPNEAVLHTDASLMPRRRRVWASWNYIGEETEAADALCVTYWMNRLQNLDPSTDLFVTLNPSRPVADDAVIRRFAYTHPLFDTAALAAQRRLHELQGRRNVWFCGSYFGHGFHEDALQSGLAVAEALGGVRRPWEVENESGRIILPPPLLEAAE